MEPKLVEVKNGWPAVGDYWAVFGNTMDDLLQLHRPLPMRASRFRLPAPSQCTSHVGFGLGMDGGG